MRYLVSVLLGLVFFFNAYAQDPKTDPLQGLIKVDKDSDAKCVEFVTYNGELYCSLTPLDSSVIDPKLLQSEKQIINFDKRPWTAAWGRKTDDEITLEYIPVGENIKQWNELITSQFIPNPQGQTASDLVDQFFKNLDKSKIDYEYQMLECNANQVIFEYKVFNPKELVQDEILKVTVDKKGAYFLHYAIKNPYMNEADLEKWFNHMQTSSIK